MRPRLRVSVRLELTREQGIELCIGPNGEGVSAFADNAERRRAWLAHGIELMEDFPGGRLRGLTYYGDPMSGTIRG